MDALRDSINQGLLHAVVAPLCPILEASSAEVASVTFSLGSAAGGVALLSGQGPNGAPTGRVFAVGISFSEGERGVHPLPPTL